MLIRLSALCALSLLAACAAKRIPGTDIDDTSETRAILAVMEQYRSAVEAKDAAAVASLVSKDFHENAGTPNDPEDDLTAENLAQYLESLFAQVQSPKVELEVRRIEVGRDLATAVYYWKANWRMTQLTSRLQKEAELERMVLRREGNTWKIVTGI
ncbi:nuclear transport factor 2 family protein [Myxococcus sp. K15C18031901]|uniref:DUF4440 domain-containing protein n=1 Tax=Myxococcus dinghuensis TaxID=2906761 RepID=UPI0020A827C8|nr:DUF4440 domain-containing protein [Myxococcus dinghuensis]MCP3097694.1 nuclear transport factor 2 family protein [Myxococcus dinghuensis]